MKSTLTNFSAASAMPVGRDRSDAAVRRPSLFGQSCSLCYTQAAASTARFIQALRSGILILMIPPMFLSIGITVLTYRRRNEFHS